MEQPLDTETWYAHRLRVAAVCSGGQAQVTLVAADGRALSAVELLAGEAVLHADPPAGAPLVATLTAPAGAQCAVSVYWPDADAQQVTRSHFPWVQFAAPGRASVLLGAGLPVRLAIEQQGAQAVYLEPADITTVAASWDAPDLVWIAGLLPARQVLTGVLVALMAGVLPTLAYVGLLYWVDLYEKEPKRLLAAAFLWGAIPAVVLSVVVELLLRLPPDLLGPRALEAARLGLLAPLLQEALKGAVVLFIAYRYRREFDDVLDGIIYGATVGFGFAMTGNVLAYLGSFALWGFEGLSGVAFAEGVVHALDQALYTAVFGAGLGYARLAKRPWQRWAVPLGAFVLTVLTHIVHQLAGEALLGLSVLTVLMTGAGLAVVGVVAAWSLLRQQRCLRAELPGEVPAALVEQATVRTARARAEWRALRTRGWRGWRRTRRMHQLCAELAFKKLQARVRPDEPGVAGEIERLRRALSVLVEGAGPG